MNSISPQPSGQGGVSAPGQLLHSGPARTLSFFLASVFCAALVLFPQLVIQRGAPPHHGLLVLGLLGMAAGFVHGVGFIPRKRVFRFLFGPSTAWLLMPLAAWLMLGSSA